MFDISGGYGCPGIPNIGAVALVEANWPDD
jgi:hypothetical protein